MALMIHGEEMPYVAAFGTIAIIGIAIVAFRLIRKTIGKSK